MGELHFDSAGTYDTFLRHECDIADDVTVMTMLQEVDFAREAVMVSRGPLAMSQSRCLATRELDEVWVCDGGLKIAYTDEERTDGLCPEGRWIVAFALPRAELRAALAALQ
ncbi:MAG: hypothetical protein ACO3JL_14565 [Myxococcota bacterium]